MLSIAPVTRTANITADRFRAEYLASEQPVIIDDLTAEWPATQRWYPDYFRQVAGDRVVPLYDSKPATGKQHQHAAAAHMPLAEYIDRLEEGESDLRMFFWQIMKEVPELADDFEYPDLGIRFFKKLPVLFFAGAGARVNLHFDIDLADILLCHFGGAKTVYLFSPDQTPNLYRVPYSFSTVFDIDPTNPDYERFPRLADASGFKAELRHGDALYIPSGYWHYVVYEEISCSMSLRSLPRDLSTRARMVNNIAVLRTIDATMRRLVGDAWVARNLKKAMQ